jgi:hypothetical protein
MQKTKFSVAFFLVLLNGIFAAEPEQSTFRDFGIDFPLIVKGRRPQIAIGLPQYAGTNPKEVQGKIKLKVAPEASPDSRVFIFINDKLLHEAAVGDARDIMEIPISYSSTVLPLIFKVAGEMSSSDEQPPWIMFDSESEIVFSRKSENIIQKYLNSGNKTISVVLGDDSLETRLAGLHFASMVGAYFSPIPIDLDWDSSSGSGKIIISRELQDMEERGGDLHISSQKIISSQSIEQWLNKEHRIDESPGSFYLSQLGFHTQTLKGKGELLTGFTLSQKAFQVIPDSLQCVFYIQCKSESSAPVYASFFLNGVESVTIRLDVNADTFRPYRVNFPSHLLKSTNFISCRFFSFFPGSETVYEEIEVTLAQNSIVRTSGQYHPETMYVSDFARYFTGKGLVVMTELTPDYYQAAAKLMSLFGQQQGLSASIDLASSVPASGNYDYTIWLGAAKNIHTMNPVLYTNERYTFADPISNKLVFKNDFYEKQGVLQAYFNNRGPVLLASDRKGLIYPWLSQLTASKLRLMQGSTAIVYDGIWYSVPFRGKVIPIYPDRYTIVDWWRSYKMLVVAFLAILSGLFIRHVKNKLTKRKPVLENV